MATTTMATQAGTAMINGRLPLPTDPVDLSDGFSVPDNGSLYIVPSSGIKQTTNPQLSISSNDLQMQVASLGWYETIPNV